MRHLTSIPLLLALLGPLQALAANSTSASPSQVCDNVAVIAAKQSGVPVQVLRAITRTETGKKRTDGFGPWPWTVNMEGKGVWFDTLDDARAYVFRHFKRGARSFDVGCFQINYKWHHQEFTSIDQMFDPEANALYAARFLKDLYTEYGSWSAAAGAYHSRNAVHANRYRKIFDRHLARLGDHKPTTAAPIQPSKPGPQRVNNFPLLVASQRRTGLASLVPLRASTPSSSFFAPRKPVGG